MKTTETLNEISEQMSVMTKEQLFNEMSELANTLDTDLQNEIDQKSGFIDLLQGRTTPDDLVKKIWDENTLKVVWVVALVQQHIQAQATK